MIKIDKEQLIRLHESLIRSFGGSQGVRDEFLLDLCLASPFQTFDGKDLYPDTIKKGGASRLFVGKISSFCRRQQTNRRSRDPRFT